MVSNYDFSLDILYFRRIRNYINVIILHLSLHHCPSLLTTMQCSLVAEKNVNRITIKLIHGPIKSNNIYVRHLSMLSVTACIPIRSKLDPALQYLLLFQFYLRYFSLYTIAKHREAKGWILFRPILSVLSL